jgi:uncharacterized protein YwgA
MSLLNEKRLALMLLLYAPGATGQTNEPVEGITRLQKLMFLLNKEHKVTSTLKTIDFTAYAFGPFSPELYDEIAFLRNMGLLASADTVDGRVQERPSRDAFEAENEQDLYDYLMGDVAENVPDSYQTEKFSLSQRGIDEVQGKLKASRGNSDVDSVMAAITDIKVRFNSVPLRALIRYVYENYPKYAENSIIANRI